MGGRSNRVADPRRPWSLEGCATLLHQRACREKMFMMLASLDTPERGNCSGKGMGVAGLLGSQVTWEEFEGEIPALISRGMKLDALLRAIDSAGIIGICAVTSSERPAAPAGVDPLLACFQHCVLEAARRLAPAPAGETVCFVMDWHEPIASMALWHLEHLTHFAPPAARERLGALGFEHAQTFRPLQLARALARRCRELIPDASGPGTRPPLPGLDWAFLNPGPSHQAQEHVPST